MTCGRIVLSHVGGIDMSAYDGVIYSILSLQEMFMINGQLISNSFIYEHYINYKLANSSQ